MSLGNITRPELESRTVRELRVLCMNEGVTGMSKQRKDVLVNTLITVRDEILNQDVKGLNFNTISTLTKPDAEPGDRTTSAIQVSCGASSEPFPVSGKTVGAVAEFLREVLNIDRFAQGNVNGEVVEDDYVLREGDVLEFIKPASEKG